MTRPTPDFDWYSGHSKRLGLKSPRCPFANVNACPRYYASLSLLGHYGCTSIEEAEDKRLQAAWEKSPLAPKTREQETSVTDTEKKRPSFHNFCPEVAFATFGLFATDLYSYTDVEDSEFASERLGKEGAPSSDPRWRWSAITPQHYAECSLYSQLAHDWHNLTAHPPASPAVTTILPAARRYDVFISHAGEDKSFARPLADKLKALGLRTWFDESAMCPGDSLREEIDKGLAGSDFGVVLLSKDFFKKQWTKAELNGLFTLKLEGKNRIIPVWHDITKAEIISHSPMIADLLALRSVDGADSVAMQILRVVRPAAMEVISAVSPPSKHSLPASSGSHGGKFQIELGKRHRHLREKILKINPRRMADFYGFEKVAQLEACERGDDEFPTAAIKKLREFFFVTRNYLEEGSQEIFESFEITCSADDCKKFLAQDFEPFLLCLNDLRDQMMCYPVLHKEEDGLARVIVANSYGYFASGGGGKSNVMHFIEAIQDKGIASSSVPIQKVDRKIWDALEAKTFYFTGIGRFLGPDPEAQGCFIEWFEEFTRQK